MTTIAIIGGTGYVGRHITTEALSRGHQVISVSRTAAMGLPAGVEVRTGSIEDEPLTSRLFADVDVVVVAIHGAADGKPYLARFVPLLLTLAAEHNTRLGVVGGVSSLLVAPGGPRVIDLPEFPEQSKPEANAHTQVLEAFHAAQTSADWFYLSPPAYFGARIPGVRTETPAHHQTRFTLAY